MRKLKRKARDYKDKAITYKEEAHNYRLMMSQLYGEIEKYNDRIQREQYIVSLNRESRDRKRRNRF